jgi:hypothetical protein
MTEEGIESVTAKTDRTVERIGQPGGERLSALAKLFEADELLDTDEIAGLFHWPNPSADEAAREWPALRSWVDRLMARFPHLDHHVIPRCWFLHNGHVEALAALRDQERVNYGKTAPGTAGVDWHRAFRDVEARLREWTAQLACGATREQRTRQGHPTIPDEWDAFIKKDIERRSRRAIDDALTERGPLITVHRAIDSESTTRRRGWER